MSSAGGGSAPRLVIALSVACALAVFLLYTSLAGSATPSLTPLTVVGHKGVVTLAGAAVGPLTGDAHGSSGLRFTLKEIGGTATVPVVYRGSVPDLFKLGRHVFLQGQLRRGVFEAVPGSLVTKCPSKYVPKGNA
ncbi:MAG TPA: cytochrome c maturation protein CcmE [Gaiellaceae bacterium]|nr:cytochrome c maturation protein CcmE [Gaiellaceae bacterium]